MNSSPKKPHVVVLSYPALGHINPMLQFSKLLVSKGIKTTFSTTFSIFKTLQIDQNTPVTFETISDGFDNNRRDQIVTPEIYFPKLREIGTKSLTNLVEKLDATGSRVDMLVYDAFLPWALDVAKKFGIVGAVFFTQTCAVNSIYYHVNRKLVTLPLSSLVVSIPGLPQLQAWETPSFVHNFGVFPDVCDLVFGQFDNIDQVDWVFFNTFYKLEEEVLDWMSKLWRVRAIGPTLPSMYLDYGTNLSEPNHSECMKWLNDKPRRSVVYLSFGSMAQLGAEQMEEIAWGLTEGNFNFLWVVRSLEEEKLPKEFVDNTSKKGLLVTWCAQLEVLAHESIGCFVTHCGLNSILEAISLGVPMVAMPHWWDQPTNAKYVEDVWRIGVRTKADALGIVRRKDLVMRIREVMEGEKGQEIKKNVSSWRDSAREAMVEGGSSDKNIDEFVQELKLSI